MSEYLPLIITLTVTGFLIWYIVRARHVRDREVDEFMTDRGPDAVLSAAMLFLSETGEFGVRLQQYIRQLEQRIIESRKTERKLKAEVRELRRMVANRDEALRKATANE